MFKKSSAAAASGEGEQTGRAPWLVAVGVIKFLCGVIVVLIVSLIGMVVWHQTNPVTIKEPVYVEFQSSGNNYVLLSRAGEDITTNEALISREMRRYVMLREPVTKADEQARYPQVMSMSCGNVATVFKQTYGGPEGPFVRAGLKREIIIHRDNAVAGATGVHQVEFSMRDWVEGVTKRDEVKPSNWVATIAYFFDEKRKTLDKHDLNPMGVCISEYTVTRRGGE